MTTSLKTEFSQTLVGGNLCLQFALLLLLALGKQFSILCRKPNDTVYQGTFSGEALKFTQELRQTGLTLIDVFPLLSLNTP